jgi:hypothetical protein
MFSGGELQRSFNIPAKPIDLLETLPFRTVALGVQDAVREPGHCCATCACFCMPRAYGPWFRRRSLTMPLLWQQQWVANLNAGNVLKVGNAAVTEHRRGRNRCIAAATDHAFAAKPHLVFAGGAR